MSNEVSAELIELPRGTFRIAKPEDAPRVLDALRWAIKDSHHSPITDEAGAIAYVTKQIERGFVLLGEFKERIVGLVIGEVGAEEWSTEPFLDVRIMYVEPAFRSSVLAWEFMRAISDFADLNGLSVTLGVAGRENTERMMAGRGLRAEYTFIGGVFVRRANREKESS